jgi:hypothetical protein
VSAASELSKTRSSVGTLIGGSVKEAVSKHSTKGISPTVTDGDDRIEAVAADVWGSSNKKKTMLTAGSGKPTAAMEAEMLNSAGVNAVVAKTGASSKYVSGPSSSRRTSVELDSEPYITGLSASAAAKTSGNNSNNKFISGPSHARRSSVDLDSEPHVINLDKTANRRKSRIG